MKVSLLYTRSLILWDLILFVHSNGKQVPSQGHRCSEVLQKWAEEHWNVQGPYRFTLTKDSSALKVPVTTSGTFNVRTAELGLATFRDDLQPICVNTDLNFSGCFYSGELIAPPGNNMDVSIRYAFSLWKSNAWYQVLGGKNPAFSGNLYESFAALRLLWH